jgi:hypothetical protein
MLRSAALTVTPQLHARLHVKLSCVALPASKPKLLPQVSCTNTTDGKPVPNLDPKNMTGARSG